MEIDIELFKTTFIPLSLLLMFSILTLHREAAAKNAFVLNSKHKYEQAILFFLLANRLSDAVNICLKNLQDYQLALLIAIMTEKGWTFVPSFFS